jgi:integrase
VDIAGKLQQINARLRASHVGVAVDRRGDRLRLRATLPPKPNSRKRADYQQRIATGLPANPAGLKEAEKRARLLGAQLAAREFSWADWGYQETIERRSCGEWIAAYKTHYLGQGGTTTTWEGDYAKPLGKLPTQATLSAELLETLVRATRANSRSRQRAAMAAGALAKFAGLNWSATHLRGNYSPAKAAPRDLPTDEAIATFRDGLTNRAWRWVYGVMAVYGLRNHEVFHLDLSRFPVVQVLETTKTGAREVWPCYPEWAERWQLQQRVLPPVDTSRTNEAIGHSVTKYLSPKLPFTPYDLRHAWAVRTLLYRWPVELSARQMGHSVEVHTRTYQRWISAQQIQGVYDLLVNRPDRPRPPRVSDQPFQSG